MEFFHLNLLIPRVHMTAAEILLNISGRCCEQRRNRHPSCFLAVGWRKTFVENNTVSWQVVLTDYCLWINRHWWINDGGPSQTPPARTCTAHPAPVPENDFPTCCWLSTWIDFAALIAARSSPNPSISTCRTCVISSENGLDSSAAHKAASRSFPRQKGNPFDTWALSV